MIRRAQCFGCILIIALIVRAPVAFGAAPDSNTRQADAAIQRGIDHLRHDQYEDALREFLAAYRISPTPRAVAQIGLANQALGRLADAERRLMEALTSTEDRWIRTRRADLEASLSDIRSHLGSLDVQGYPAGAEIRIAGETVGALPLRRPLRWPIGTVTVEISASGYAPLSKVIEIQPGRPAALWADLVEIRPDVPSSLMPRNTPDPAPLIDHTQVRSREGHGSRVLKPVSWACLVVGAAVAGTGTTLWAGKDHDRLGPALVAAGAGALVAGLFGLLLATSNSPPDSSVSTSVAGL